MTSAENGQHDEESKRTRTRDLPLLCANGGSHSFLHPSFEALCSYAHVSSLSFMERSREEQHQNGGLSSSAQLSNDSRACSVARGGPPTFSWSASFCSDKQLVTKYVAELRKIEQWRFLCIDWEVFRQQKKQLLKQKVRAGIPDCLRGVVWQLLADIEKMKIEGSYEPNLYAKLLHESHGCTSNSIPAIVRDINRIFPKHVLFRDLYQKGQEALFNVLKAYAMYNPKVGYCQGMGFIIGILLMHMNEEDAFYMLVCLLDKYNLQGLFTPGLPSLEKCFFQFQKLLPKHMPELESHFRREGVEASMYLSGWIMTLFAYNFSFESVDRIWDIFLKEGEKMLFRTALAILKMKENFLMNSTFEMIMEALKSTPSELEADKLIESALSMKVTNSALKKLECDYRKEKSLSTVKQISVNKRDVRSTFEN